MNGLNGYLNDWFCVPFLNRSREGKMRGDKE
jgi:hypothetical protein